MLLFKSGTEKCQFSVPLYHQIDLPKSKLVTELYIFCCTARQRCTKLHRYASVFFKILLSINMKITNSLLVELVNITIANCNFHLVCVYMNISVTVDACSNICHCLRDRSPLILSSTITTDNFYLLVLPTAVYVSMVSDV